MPLWGSSDAVEAKPKHFTDAEKLNVFATEQGWVKKTTGTGGRAGRTFEEVIVAIGDLSTSLNLADITAIDWNTTTADKSDGFTLSVRARFNEAVDVNTTGGTPYLAVTNGNEGSGTGRGPHNLAYASGTGTNELVFSLAIAAANAATNADDVLVIGANAMNLNSGTIKDAGTSTNATITNSSAIGTAAGSLTVTA